MGAIAAYPGSLLSFLEKEKVFSKANIAMVN
jgi:hypothetical protein